MREALRIANSAADRYDEVWALVDVDDHAGLREACELADAKSVRLAVGNPAFEVWLLWHYQDQRAAVTREGLRRSLKARGHQSTSLPTGFPFGAYEEAADRARTADRKMVVCRVGGNPSSSFALFLETLTPR